MRAHPLALAAFFVGGAFAQDIPRPQPLRPGIEFQSADVKSLQADDFANPGMFWVTKGAQLWATSPAQGMPSCRTCHADAPKSMRGVAATYPKHDANLARVVSLEQRIDACRRDNQLAAPLAPESEERLALSAFVAHQSRGMPINVSTAGPARAVFDQGAALYRQRIGQMNLACTHCHDATWGKTLLAESVSQGHPAGWPAYRLEWQSLGSLSRRLRACFYGVKAEQPAYDSADLLALELYLAVRSSGMAIEAPAVRR